MEPYIEYFVNSKESWSVKSIVDFLETYSHEFQEYIARRNLDMGKVYRKLEGMKNNKMKGKYEDLWEIIRKRILIDKI